MKVESFLNEPLSAFLEVNNVASHDLVDIQFSVASEAEYRKLLGINRPDYLDKLQLSIRASDNNQHQLEITTRHRIVEPIINLLLKVSEKQNSFIKKFTLLMDPESVPKITQSAAPRIKITTLTTAAKKDNPVVPSGLPNVKGRQTLQVRNRSISLIAQNSVLHERFSVYQIMRAFYLENPQAFEKGNIDKLMSGSTLIVPDESLIAQVPRQQAVNFVYSKSRDIPDPAARKPITVQQPGDNLLVANSAASTTVSAGNQPPAQSALSQQSNQQSATPVLQQMQSDLKSWRSMASGFSSLSDMIETQNKAIQRQNSALLALSKDFDKHEQQISLLDQRLYNMTSLDQNVIVKDTPAISPENRIISDQSRVIERMKDSFALINQQLAEQDAEINQLRSQLVTMSELNKIQLTQPVPENSQQPKPAAISEMPAPKIITYVNPQAGDNSKIWFVLMLIAAALLFALREWIWRRKLKSLSQMPATEPETPKAQTKPSTYTPGHEDSGTIELRDLKVAKKKSEKREGVVAQSRLKLESNSVEEVKIEVDVLIAYEQYPDALQLVKTAREKFGEDPWLDIKQLEILASSKQCDAFYELYNKRKVGLQSELPEPWEKIEEMRTRQCKEFKISAVIR